MRAYGLLLLGSLACLIAGACGNSDGDIDAIRTPTDQTSQDAPRRADLGVDVPVIGKDTVALDVDGFNPNPPDVVGDVADQLPGQDLPPSDLPADAEPTHDLSIQDIATDEGGILDVSSAEQTEGIVDACTGDCTGSFSAMATVPAGKFRMGCNTTVDEQCSGQEFPYHVVEVESFSIDINEVTAGQYAECVAAGVCLEDISGATYWSACTLGEPGMEKHPMTCVDWQQAHDYCEWAGRRLCTGAEWEKAARGGCELYDDCAAESQSYPWGNIPATCELAAMDDGGTGCGTGLTFNIGSFPGGASPYGVVDMAGNAGEWIQDCWHPSYEAAEDGSYGPPPVDGSSWEEPVCAWEEMRGIRGGSWYYFAEHLRVSFREGRFPDIRSGTLGFRCCRSL